MKKVLACILSLILVVALSVSVMATGFVKSPVLNDAPEIKDFETEVDDPNCHYDLAVTPYEERTDLSAEAKQEIEKAYEEIKANDDLTKLVADLTKVAEDKKIEGENLAVSQLFDISEEECAEHADHGVVTIHLTADLKNFVALLHKTDAGWVVVSSAKVTGTDTITFSVDELSPFAIVVDATQENNSSTGDNANLALYISLMAVSAVALVVVIVLMKKKSN
ncbi:MAG: sortase B protein-sorting domain-containing protein [Clostridia bacterium]|nr:sortase B protein-sorting domain-containing protein [Clostridia bacterium]